MQESLDAISHVNELFRLLVARYGEKRQPNTLGLTSRSLYDTAWVSLVSRRYNSRIEWVFPNAFDRVCEAQRDDGGWDAASGEPVDSIIVTLACLLSLKRHQGAAWSRALAGKIFRKATKAIAWLNTSLESEWDVDSTHRRVLELTVPNLLDLLVKEGVSFVWPYQRCLYALRDETLSKMEDATLYSPYNPYLHCLEVLIDTLDFDRITSLGLGKGGFGHSPSFAAAYLMKASKWDKDVEAYLQQALHSCGDGFVPAIYPCVGLEVSSCVVELGDAGFDFSVLDVDVFEKLSVLLKEVFSAGGDYATVFSLARTMRAMQYFGLPSSVDKLVKRVERASSYGVSFADNCNVLIAFLAQRVSVGRVSQAASDITDAWWNSNSPFIDPSNESLIYPVMLATHALTRLLWHFAQGYYPALSDEIVNVRIPISLMQMLTMTLESQHENGSWGRREETAYAILALARLAGGYCV